jgi:hypothetical protein
MPEAVDIARLIGGLSHADPAQRQSAATELQVIASALCRSAIDPWLDVPEFRALLLALETHPADRTFKWVAGIAVRPETFEKIRRAHRSPPLAEVPPDQDALEFELHLGEGIDFDILTTHEPAGTGAIARYLRKFGEGIQQIEIFVTHVDRATQILYRRFQLSPTYRAARPGAGGTRVNFFLVPTLTGKKVLIEIVEATLGRSLDQVDSE